MFPEKFTKGGRSTSYVRDRDWIKIEEWKQQAEPHNSSLSDSWQWRNETEQLPGIAATMPFPV